MAEAGVWHQQGAAGLRHEALKMAKRKRAPRSATPQAPEAATELTQLQAEVAQLQAELQEARAHSAQQEATNRRLQLRLQALEPPRPGDGVSTPPQSTSADGSATAQSQVRDIFVQELLRSQQADGPSAGPANSWVPAFVGSFIENMKISLSHFTAKGLSKEEEAKLNSEQRQAYIKEKAEEAEQLQRIADEAADAARERRVSRRRRESLAVNESAEWELRISHSVFAGSSMEKGRVNTRMDREDMLAARDMFQRLVDDATCRKWLEDPHVLWHGCPLRFQDMRLTDGHPCLLPGDDDRIWASCGPLGAQSMFVHVAKEKKIWSEDRGISHSECVTAVGIGIRHNSWKTFTRAGVGIQNSEQYIYVRTPETTAALLLPGAIILEATRTSVTIIHDATAGAKITAEPTDAAAEPPAIGVLCQNAKNELFGRV
eukprot:COSAG01_NODE_1538_length_9984_cov_92.104097_1_plen_431_part_00